MEPPENQIASITLTSEGLAINYVRFPRDIRKNGLVWQHSVSVPYRSDYDDEIEALVEAAQALLADVLDDEDRAEPIDPSIEEEEEDDDDD